MATERVVVDMAYEFDAPRFCDFTRLDDDHEEAESWFGSNQKAPTVNDDNETDLHNEQFSDVADDISDDHHDGHAKNNNNDDTPIDSSEDGNSKKASLSGHEDNSDMSIEASEHSPIAVDSTNDENIISTTTTDVVTVTETTILSSSSTIVTSSVDIAGVEVMPTQVEAKAESTPPQTEAMVTVESIQPVVATIVVTATSAPSVVASAPPTVAAITAFKAALSPASVRRAIAKTIADRKAAKSAATVSSKASTASSKATSSSSSSVSSTPRGRRASTRVSTSRASTSRDRSVSSSSDRSRSRSRSRSTSVTRMSTSATPTRRSMLATKAKSTVSSSSVTASPSSSSRRRPATAAAVTRVVKPVASNSIKSSSSSSGSLKGSSIATNSIKSTMSTSSTSGSKKGSVKKRDVSASPSPSRSRSRVRGAITKARSPNLSTSRSRSRSTSRAPVSSSLELQLKAIEEGKAKVAKQLAANAAKAAQVLAPIGQVLPNRSVAPLTMPKEFSFHESKRTKTPTTTSTTVPSPRRTPRVVLGQPTQPQPFNLATSARGSTASVTSSPSPRKRPAPAPVGGVTKPAPFQLSTSTRSRTSSIMSAEEKEAAEMAAIKPFKAQPVPDVISFGSGDIGVMRHNKRPRTIPTPFELKSLALAEASRAKFQEQLAAEGKAAIEATKFKAAPITSLVPEPLPAVTPRPVTVPQSPVLHTSERAHVVRHHGSDDDNDGFEAFKARPVPNSVPFIPKLPPIAVTEPQPFALRSVELHEHSKMALAAKLEAERLAEEEARHFKAKENLSKKVIPFQPVKSNKPLTEVEPVVLFSGVRAEARDAVSYSMLRSIVS
jgi:hypothetical protein